MPGRGLPAFDAPSRRRSGRSGRRSAPVRPVSVPDYDTDVEDDLDVADGADEVLWSASAPPTGFVAAPAEPDASVRGLRQSLSSLEEPEPPPGKRVRVVLAERKGVARPVRTVVDIQEGTGVGEVLRDGLIADQLSVALKFAVFAGLTLGSLPLLFALVPEIGLIEVLGIRLPWLLLGFLVYPFLLGLGWLFTRAAERVEQSFADHVQD